MSAALRSLAGVVFAVAAGAAVVTAQLPERAAADLHAQAVALEARGDFDRALPLFWEAAARAPHDPAVQNSLGEALARVGALDAAVDAFKQALKTQPGFHKAANNLVLTLVTAGRGQEALSYARALVAAAPADPASHFSLGLAQSEQDADGAIASFHRVLERSPRHALARYNLALVLKRADRTSEAIDELQRVIAIDARAGAHYTLGVIYWQQGAFDRAVPALRAATTIDPANAEAYATLGAVLKERRQWDEAIAALRRAVALRPDHWNAHYQLGAVLQMKGDAAAARRHADEAERLRREGERMQEARVWTSVAIGRIETADFVGALDHLRRAVAAYERYAPAHYHMGRTLQALGQPDAARQSFDRARQLNPGLVPPAPPR